MKKNYQLQIACIVTTTGKHKSLRALKKCLKSLQLNSSLSASVKLYLVTEKLGSTDLSTSNITVLFSPPSCGFGCKNNLAIRHILNQNHYDYILLLNDDAWLHPDFFSNLNRVVSSHSTQPDVIIPIIYKADDTRKIDAFGMEIFLSGYAFDANKFDYNTCWGTASCIVFSSSYVTKMIRNFGTFFNPYLYYYYEDVELGIRGLSLDPEIIKSSALVAYHQRSSTSGLDSPFVVLNILQSYFWYVITSWPPHMVHTHWWRFGLVYSWLIIRTLLNGQIHLVWQVLVSTGYHLHSLLKYRKIITSAYPPNYDPSSLLSPYLFRTRKGNHAILL